MPRRVVRFLPLIAIALIALSCRQRTPNADSVRAPAPVNGPVTLRNGPNNIALLGDSTPGLAFVSWRGNYNAHGFSVVTFSIRNPSDLSDFSSIWQNVPFFGGPYDGDTGREIFRTSEGADCTLGDLRVIQHVNAPVEVVVASRQPGASFADTAAVRFDYYKVVHNREGSVGWPPTHFQFVRSVPARHGYCDVNQAFNNELHLGTAGLGRAEGGR
jgi:hypothetical protein